MSLKSDKGDLSVILELRIGNFSEKQEAGRGHQNLQRRQVGPSQLRRRERRASDKDVQRKAAEYAASLPAAAENAASTSAEQATLGAPALDGQAAAAQAAPAGQAVHPGQGVDSSPEALSAPRSCTRCNLPCRLHVGPTGARCTAPAPSLGQPRQERIRTSSLHISLTASPEREEARESEREDNSLPPASPTLPPIPVKVLPSCPPHHPITFPP